MDGSIPAARGEGILHSMSYGLSTYLSITIELRAQIVVEPACF